MSSSNYSDCVASLRTSVSLLESSVNTLGSGVADFPRLGAVLKTVRHYELIPQPTLAAAEASLRDEIGPFVSHLLDRAEHQVERQARRIETLKARSGLNAGRLGRESSTSTRNSGSGSGGGTRRHASPAIGGRSSSGSGVVGAASAGGGSRRIATRASTRAAARKTLDGGAGLRARAVRQKKEALKYSVERLELEVVQKERELRMRLQDV